MRLYLAARPLPPLPRGEARQGASLAVRELLFLLLDSIGISKSPSDLAATPEGRPFLLHCPQIDFSFSHTDSTAFCLLAISEGREPTPRVGLDAELLSLSREKAIRLAKRFFAPEELCLFEKSGQTAQTFLEIFTGKEAFAKYDGRGLAKTLKIDTVCPLFNKTHHASLHRLPYPDHVVTLCLPQDTSASQVVLREL